MFVSFKVLLWTCKYFYSHCIYKLCKNIALLCWVYEKKIKFSLFISQFFIRNFINVMELVLTGLWGGGVTSLKQTYVGKRIHVKRTWTKKGRGGQYLKFRASLLFKYSQFLMATCKLPRNLQEKAITIYSGKSRCLSNELNLEYVHKN